MKGKRLGAFLLLACMVFSLFPAAALGEESEKPIEVTEVGGAAQIAIPLTNDGSEDKIVEYVIPKSGGPITGASIINGEEEGVKIPAGGGPKNIFLDLTINTNIAHSNGDKETLLVYYKGIAAPDQITVSLNFTTEKEENISSDEDDTEEPNPNTTLEKALVLDSMDLNGNVVPAPIGNSGERVRVVLPLINRNVNVWSFYGNKLTGITVTPVLSADQASFPFVIEEVDYSRRVPDMSPGMKQEVIYDFLISDKATSGVKEVKFNAVYFNNAKETYESTTFSVFVNVVDGAGDKEEGITDEDGNVITSTPKLIVESYTVTPVETAEEEGEEEQDTGDRLFAGEEFDLTFVVRNTSDEESIENVEITLENADGAILPAQGGSNALYIKKIGSGQSEERTVRLQSVPDAEAKSHTLSIKFGYESGKTHKSYDSTASLSLPVSQRMRIKVDDPTVYETMVMPEQSVGVYFGLYNMGKSTIYNCMVDVEGEGLRMEESYFGGNISAGGTMRADFSIIPSTPGEIEGNILIIYEDVYGEQTILKKPITLTVMDDSDMGIDMGDPMMDMEVMAEPEPQGLPWWVYGAIGAGVLLIVIIIILKVRKARRKKEIEDA